MDGWWGASLQCWLKPTRVSGRTCVPLWDMVSVKRWAWGVGERTGPYVLYVDTHIHTDTHVCVYMVTPEVMRYVFFSFL
jgi:hypothetical protein